LKRTVGYSFIFLKHKDCFASPVTSWFICGSAIFRISLYVPKERIAGRNARVNFVRELSTALSFKAPRVIV